MAKYKRVGGKTFRRVPGAPALWFSDQERRKKGVPKTYSTMELEAKRKRLRKK